MDYLKIQKAVNRIRHIRNTMDILEYADNILSLEGWIFAENTGISDFQLVVKAGKKKYPVQVKYGIERIDVYQFYQNENAKMCGFYGRVIVKNVEDFTVYLQFSCGGRKEKMFMGKYQGIITDKEREPVVRIWNNIENGIDYMSRLVKNRDWRFVFPEEYRRETVDIIVPVYNGYEFLETLFAGIPNTDIGYQLYLIDDCSPDKRVYPFLEKYAGEHVNIHLYRNEENLGFVKTVNRGLALSEHHVAIVNTDVELPALWLERLMLPIFMDEKTASSTPYTNCGTSCSFPNFYEDNEIFLGLDVQQIDEEFIKMKPSYESMPTGVGFCMGMNRSALDAIGYFDADSFEKGYGEENDWCQRAVKSGYRNVQVENMFVYHKHGGSFLSEDKKRFIKEHEKILLKKHPLYNKEVSRFFTLDPNREIRQFAAFELILKYRSLYNILAFDHNRGGGASAYLEGKKESELKEGHAFTIVRYDSVDDIYKVKFYYEKHEINLMIRKKDELFELFDRMPIEEIWINELVAYPDLYEWMKKIVLYKSSRGATLRMLVHDFYPICPTLNLLDCKGNYCFVQSGETCNQCLQRVLSLQYLYYGSMEDWRRNWGEFLRQCDEIITFSANSREILGQAFGKLEHVKVVPHVIGYIPRLEKRYKTTDTLNIGLLGILAKHKGRDIVERLVHIVEKQNINIRVILIGSTIGQINSPVFTETGEYTRDMIPRLVLENDIDVFLIPSIWPETFSYTTEEIMHMGMPVMCFDIGAPADRIKEYEYGTIIPEISAESVLETVRRNGLMKQCADRCRRNKKVLFIVEDITFSSRYRVDHFREQLLYQGISSDFVLIDQCTKKELQDYCSIVVYRGSKKRIIRSLVQKAHGFGKKVYYDIDDYIFDYDGICHLDFLKGNDYTNFEKYSSDIRETMGLCDGYIVSTNNLKKVLNALMPDKPVYINRNSASMEMVMISMDIKKDVRDDEIILGYFSGSNTHDKDFEQIKDAIIYIMDQNPNVKLLAGGQIELPTEFNRLKDRIEYFKFVDWKKLPSLIARADINLMPLEDTLFHACKSENKWMEAALAGIPTVASRNSELEGAVSLGVTGYLCSTDKEWRETLQVLIDDSELRRRIAENARQKVLQEYTTLSVEPEVIEALLVVK